MTQVFRMAIIGTGQIAAHGHLPAVLSSRKTELAALVDVNPARATALAKQYGITPLIAESINKVVDQVDGVIIATPNHTHRTVALECIRNGLPILIEKPLAATLPEGEQIMEAAVSNGVLAAVGYCTRFHENAHILSTLLAQNYFGQVRRWVYQWGVRDWAAPLTGYSFKKGAAGGGVLMVNGSHFLDRMLQWFGYPTTMQYFDDSMGGPESAALARLYFDNGTLSSEGLIRLSKAFRLVNGFVMETDAGIIRMPDDSSTEIMFRPAGRRDLEMVIRSTTPQYDPETSPFQRQLEDFVEACRTKRKPLVPVQDGLTSLRLIESLYSLRQPLEEGSIHRDVLSNN